MASITASSTFHSLSTTKSLNLSSTHLLPPSKNLTFRSKPIGHSRICIFTKQNRLGLRKLSSLGEGGEAVAVADDEQQQQQQETVSVPVSPSDMLTIFFQVHCLYKSLEKNINAQPYLNCVEDHAKYYTLVISSVASYGVWLLLAFFFGLILKADGTLNEAAIPNVTKALQVILWKRISHWTK